ncbi:MAG: aminotransferase class I/II-fold pyridoxal phosphate-dependent enzyme [Planctomycetota bacterium]|nr:aminotransferase class I/II-fold pyridoxal phosphate-dependent enzyme [Planctomycetota bacterium]
MTDAETNYRLATLALHAGQGDDPATHARAVPIYATAAYNFESTDHAANLFALKEFGNIYSRLQNPTCQVLEERLAALDGGAAALVFASGMAAITAAVATLTSAGQNIVTASSLYGGTVTLFTQTLPKLGIEARFFDADSPEQAAGLIDENTRCVYIESIGNPKNDVPDFEKLADIAHSGGCPLIVDNTVPTPALFRPVEHGADIVVYSTTKYIGGHGLHVGGAVVDGGKFDWSADADKWPQMTKPDPAYHGVVFTELVKDIGNIAYVAHMRTHWLRDTGAAMSPFAAWIFLLGLETLHVRIPRHIQNANAVAKWLSRHKCVQWVNHPSLPGHPHHELAKKYMPDGAGAIVGFGILGGRQAGRKFIDSVRLCSHLANIGDAKTLVIHPASTTHQQLSDAEQKAAGVSPEYVRLCVGIEDVEDIKADLGQALKASQK